MTTGTEIAWIAADWGTTNLRIWALDAAGDIRAHRQSDRGMGKLNRDGFEPALLDLISDLLPSNGSLPVIICGMAGSRQGWAEAPYKSAPCAPPTIDDATIVSSEDARLDVRILPGIKQMAPPDVMRGEETQIAGFLADHTAFSGTLCLPGTHSKWVALEDGRVERFQTFMTGESFALYSEHSVLRHGLASGTLNMDAFRDAVVKTVETPSGFASDLFAVRAAGLIAGQTPEEASGRLSGLLIGAELAAVRDNFNLDDVVLLGSDRIATSYRSALGCLGYQVQMLDAGSITLRGLALAYSSFSKGSS
ncbi:2-dehydro-3-deoxygalactonokinase [Roseibium sp.]|uniref:2-dehydro-3-deoxygalactonokinase n=1 Tax=Roseibium sp. TaxID=1936156 RepID=UPI003BAF582E